MDVGRGGRPARLFRPSGESGTTIAASTAMMTTTASISTSVNLRPSVDP
ncbi:MAG: hypothetical protein IPH91_00040 [Elusimicrobia bacterium]|nr:hypothetical protein [Elusimicrobiota bacterium]